MENNYLALDFGASNGRVIIGSYNGSKIVLNDVHRFRNEPVKIIDTLYWDILYLFSQAKKGLVKAYSDYKNIKSLSLNSWGVDFAFIDKKGRLISNPVSYRDLSKQKEIRKNFYNKITKRELFQITSINPIYNMVALFYLYKMKLNKYHELDFADKFLMIPDLLNYFFTEVCCSEFTIANNSMLLNWRTSNWDEKIINALQISRNLFPEIIMTGEKIGDITKKLRNELSFNKIPVIAAASHDTASSLVGIPAKKSRKWAFLGTGTWFILGLETEKPILDEKILKYPFINEGAAEGKNFLARNMTGFWILQRCRQKWILDKKRDIEWDEIEDLAKNSIPFTAFIDIDDPIFAQNQDNMPEIIRKYSISFCGKKLENIGQIARCFYESVALKISLELSMLEKFNKDSIEVIHLIGGGAKDSFLCKCIANATSRIIIAGPVETTSLGNIIIQLKASGEIKDIEEGREISNNSSTLKIFEPEKLNSWNEIYEEYIDMLNEREK